MRIAVEENVKPTVIPRAKTACNERKGSGTISRANSVGKFKSIHRPQYNFLFMEDIFTEKPVPTYNSTNKNNRSEFVSTANTLKRHHNGKRCLFSASASKETILSLNK